jgi:formate C-acetyltransferase
MDIGIQAGGLPEFQEQRTPGHTVLVEKIYQKGFLDLKEEILQALQNLDFFCRSRRPR